MRRPAVLLAALRVRLGTPRGLLRLSVLLVLAAWVVMPSPTRAQSAEPVAVKVLVPGETQSLANSIAGALAGVAQPTSPDVEVGGTADVRASFVEGRGDAVVTGVPFTAAESAALAKAGRKVVSAPFQAVGLGVFGFVPPLPTFPEGCEEDDSCQDERQPYTGPIRFTPSVLLKMLFDKSNIWSEDEFIAELQLPPGRFYFPPVRGPRPLVRTDPDATNLYLEQFVAQSVPAEYRAARGEIAGTDPNGNPAEQWPNSVTPSRLGMDNTVSQVREGLDPGSSELSLTGSITAGSVGLVEESFVLNEGRPAASRVPLFRVQLRNAAGEWLLPNTVTISAAVAAGEGIPNAGSVGTPIPGAYPITWVNQLVAPTTGLGAAKANSVAALIRWQVSSGQTDAALLAAGDGKLTPKMVATALAAADEVVRGNCSAAKGTVETSVTAGGTAPAGGFPGLGAVSWCKAAAAATTTTAAPAPTDGGGGEVATDDLGFDESFSDVPLEDAPLVEDVPIEEAAAELPAEASVLGETATNDGVASGGAGGPVATFLAGMPLAVPGESLPPLDRAATLGIGALAYVTVRRLKGRSG